MTFEEVDSQAWKPENENDEIVGKWISSEKNVGANNSMLYTLEVDNKPIGVWGSTVLDPKMLGVKEEEMVKIIYLGKGEAKPGKNAPKLFKVLVDRESIEQTTNPAPAPVQAPAPTTGPTNQPTNENPN